MAAGREPVRSEASGSVLEITLDRPHANAIDAATSRALYGAFARLESDPERRVGIVTAVGDQFSAPAGTSRPPKGLLRSPGGARRTGRTGEHPDPGAADHLVVPPPAVDLQGAEAGVSASDLWPVSPLHPHHITTGSTCIEKVDSEQRPGY
jgi:enoyl-CoA hydratase/isomerase-like protein